VTPGSRLLAALTDETGQKSMRSVLKSLRPCNAQAQNGTEINSYLTMAYHWLYRKNVTNLMAARH
jgi:hypothetical protein